MTSNNNNLLDNSNSQKKIPFSQQNLPFLTSLNQNQQQKVNELKKKRNNVTSNHQSINLQKTPQRCELIASDEDSIELSIIAAAAAMSSSASTSILHSAPISSTSAGSASLGYFASVPSSLSSSELVFDSSEQQINQQLNYETKFDATKASNCANNVTLNSDFVQSTDLSKFVNSAYSTNLNPSVQKIHSALNRTEVRSENEQLENQLSLLCSKLGTTNEALKKSIMDLLNSNNTQPNITTLLASVEASQTQQNIEPNPKFSQSHNSSTNILLFLAQQLLLINNSAHNNENNLSVANNSAHMLLSSPLASKNVLNMDNAGNTSITSSTQQQEQVLSLLLSNIKQQNKNINIKDQNILATLNSNTSLVNSAKNSNNQSFFLQQKQIASKVLPLNNNNTNLLQQQKQTEQLPTTNQASLVRVSLLIKFC